MALHGHRRQPGWITLSRERSVSSQRPWKRQTHRLWLHEASSQCIESQVTRQTRVVRCRQGLAQACRVSTMQLDRGQQEKRGIRREHRHSGWRPAETLVPGLHEPGTRRLDGIDGA